MSLPELLQTYPSLTILKEDDFLLRSSNSFNNNIPLMIYDIKCMESTNNKIKKLFGNAQIISKEDFIIVQSKEFMQREIYSFSDLLETIRRLRDDDGCLWDKSQTNMSIRSNAVEEAYELVEAIELNDIGKMTEECGDVILQGLFNAIIAEDDNKFGVDDVISCLCKKLIFRHTHIFGENKAESEQEALNLWEKAKEIEKSQQTVSDKINAVPKTFGALMRALKVQKIIKKTGFEFPTVEDAQKKILEEFEEFINADSATNREEEAGDLLFSVVNLLRMYGIDPEIALNATVEKFIKRFYYVEESAKNINKKTEECSLEEMENWYQESKKFDRKL